MKTNNQFSSVLTITLKTTERVFYMTDLIKIREVTERYNIPARTLRYYEDMGLIESARVADYAYRLYDQRALKRLEQILILRKLNISIKDIQLIFQSAGSDVVLDVLGRKVEDINDEVDLLRDLRDIILEFIEQIRKMDFSSDADVKLLYERAATVETRIENIPYEGNASKANRLFDISEKLKKAPEVRIVQINPFKAFSSGADSIENVMGPFQEWQEAHNHLVKKMMYGSPDFLWFEEDKATWIWAVEDGVSGVFFVLQYRAHRGAVPFSLAAGGGCAHLIKRFHNPPHAFPGQGPLINHLDGLTYLILALAATVLHHLHLVDQRTQQVWPVRGKLICHQAKSVVHSSFPHRSALAVYGACRLITAHPVYSSTQQLSAEGTPAVGTAQDARQT